MLFFKTKPIEEVSLNFAEWMHDGQGFRYVTGPFVAHPFAVGSRQDTSEGVALGNDHDVFEEEAKKKLKKRGLYFDSKVIQAWTAAEREMLLPKVQAAEETIIKQEFFKARIYFQWNGYNIKHLIPALDVLTRRTTETRSENILRLKKYIAETGDLKPAGVRLADIHDNRDAARNPLPEKQDAATRERLGVYNEIAADLEQTYPQIKLMPAKLYVIPERRPRQPAFIGRWASSVASIFL